MTDQYTYPPPVAIYPGRGAMPPAPPTPPMPQLYPAPAPRKRKGGNIAALIGGATVAVLTAGVVGGLIGNHMAGTTAAPPPPAATPPTPTAEQVKASTIDLCTRFAAGYHAMPSPQNSAADVVPSLTYIMQALTDNPAADRSIRDAVEESVKLAREQASKLTNEPARGAIQPATTWTAAVANAADQKVWDLCRAYGS